MKRSPIKKRRKLKYDFSIPGNTEEGATGDIETFSGTYRSWGKMYEATLIKEVKPVRLASYSFKPFGKKPVTVGGWQFKTYEDFLYEMWKVWHVNKVVVGHNISGFDYPQCMAFFVEAGFPAPAKCILYDTYRLSTQFKWPSHKLKYCLVATKVGYKIETGGDDLWDRAENGDPEARRKFLVYNENDTVQTDKYFFNLVDLGYVKLKVLQFYSPETGCIRCGSKCHKRGPKPLAGGVYQYYCCTNKKCNRHQPGELLESWK